MHSRRCWETDQGSESAWRAVACDSREQPAANAAAAAAAAHPSPCSMPGQQSGGSYAAQLAAPRAHLAAARAVVPALGGRRLVQLLVLRPAALEALLGAEGRQFLLQAQLQAADWNASGGIGRGRQAAGGRRQAVGGGSSGGWRLAGGARCSPARALQLGGLRAGGAEQVLHAQAVGGRHAACLFTPALQRSKSRYQASRSCDCKRDNACAAGCWPEQPLGAPPAGGAAAGNGVAAGGKCNESQAQMLLHQCTWGRQA